MTKSERKKIVLSGSFELLKDEDLIKAAGEIPPAYIRDVMQVYAARQAAKPARTALTSPDKMADLFRQFQGLPIEKFFMASFNTKLKLIAVHTVTTGLVDRSLVGIGETFRYAILDNSIQIVIGHNHPSGDPSPSHADDLMTQSIKDAGKLLNIPLVDHIILANGSNKFYSYMEHKHGAFQINAVN